MSKQKILVGTWRLNDHQCMVYGRPDWGEGRGEGFLTSEKRPCLEIHISFAGSWNSCVDALLHEAMELCLLIKDCSYKVMNQALYNTETRTFMFTHGQFTEIMGLTADFATAVLTGDRPLERAWCKYHKKKMIR